MASNECDEIKELKAINTELVQKVQFWQMKAAQQEKEKIGLMKENNDLRLKLSRMRSGGAVQARALDTALQAASEAALSHLVQASTAVARTMELAKNYIREQQELDNVPARWSSLSTTPVKDKVNKVPPMMIGGRSIQPFVSLSRVAVNDTNNASSPRNPSQNRSTGDRSPVLPLPMHMLQDVYIPLRRIDTSEYTNNATSEIENEEANEELLLNDNNEDPENDGEDMEEDENLESSRLEVVHEEEEEQETENTSTAAPLSRLDNPLEGPSWLLDRPNPKNWKMARREPSGGVALEADSTTEPDESKTFTPVNSLRVQVEVDGNIFTPTVRRRKRTSSPPPVLSPTLPLSRPRSRDNGRVLQVLVPKMRLDQAEGLMASGGDGDAPASPPKRPVAFDAPSPNGATDTALIVLEQMRPSNRQSGNSSARDSSASDDNQAGRSRRPRKQVAYKEKPLNRKLRR